MKIKKEYIILFVLIVGLSLYLVLRKRDGTHYQLPKIPEISTSDISRIEISKPDASILLEKKEKKWVISPEGYPADATKVRGILDTIGKLSLTALVSQSKSYERYDLDPGKRITVKAWAGDSLRREFDVGKAAPSFRHTFVKIAGDDRVYHALDNFRGKFDQELENIRDRAVLRFEESEIQKVDLSDGQNSVTLVRQSVPVEVTAGQQEEQKDRRQHETESVWQTSGGKAVDESEFKGLLTNLSVLNCSGYIDGAKKSDFQDPVYSLKLEGVKEYTLSIFEKKKKEDKDRPAISSENDFPFLLSDSQVNRIITPIDELLKKPDESRD